MQGPLASRPDDGYYGGRGVRRSCKMFTGKESTDIMEGGSRLG